MYQNVLPYSAQRLTDPAIGTIRRDRLSSNQCLGDARVERKPPNNRHRSLSAILCNGTGACGIQISFVDAYLRRNAKMGGKIKRALHIVDSGSRRLGYYKRSVCAGDARDGRAANAGWAVHQNQREMVLGSVRLRLLFEQGDQFAGAFFRGRQSRVKQRAVAAQ